MNLFQVAYTYLETILFLTLPACRVDITLKARNTFTKTVKNKLKAVISTQYYQANVFNS